MVGVVGSLVDICMIIYGFLSYELWYIYSVCYGLGWAGQGFVKPSLVYPVCKAYGVGGSQLGLQ